MNLTNLLMAFVAFFPVALAHSWVEQLMKIGSNGAFVGEPGYPRHFVGRTEPGYNDDIFVYLLPPNGRGSGILPSDKISKYSREYRDEFPMLKAAPGDMVALRYQENGHVSLPDTQANKPLNRGTVYVYGTADAKDDDKLLSVFGQWTADGKGGDGRGRLLATRNYDDGQCHQDNQGEIALSRLAQFPKGNDPLQGEKNLWCQNDIRLPNDLAEGTIYTLYWVWVWPTLTPELRPNSKDGKFPMQGEGVQTAETYTSVSDVLITKASTSDLGINSAFVSGSKIGLDTSVDVGQRAVQDQLNNLFQVDGDATEFSSQPASSGNEANPPASNPPPSNDAPNNNAPGNSGNVVTVTVTASPATVTNFVTVTVPAGGQAPPASASPPAQANTADNLPAAEPTGVVNNAPLPKESSVIAQGAQPTAASSDASLPGDCPEDAQAADHPTADAGEVQAATYPDADKNPAPASNGQPGKSPTVANLPETTGGSPEVVQFMPRGRRWAN